MRKLGMRLVGVMLFVAGTVQAQTRPSLDVTSWWPSTDPEAGLALEPAGTPGGGNWNVGLWLNYAHRPVTLKRAGTSDVLYRPVEHALGADLTANLGVGKFASFGVSVPVLVYQNGSNKLPTTVSSVGEATKTALGDIGLHGKANLLPNDQGGFGLAALGSVLLPTGRETSFTGDGSTRVGVRLLAEYSLLIVSLQASLGYMLRTEHETWPAREVGGVRFGDMVPYSVGVLLRPGVFRLDKDNRQVWEVALHGALPAGPVGPFGAGDPGSSQLTQTMLGLSDRVAIGHSRDFALLAGVDFGVGSGVGVPLFRPVVALQWAPREHDQDHDGVADDVDQCPEIPEDRDGFEDEDGCPEIDDDDDGIIDREDACPRVPGVAQPGKKNGCPAADADGDGVFDEVDACRTVKGVPTQNPKSNGCPLQDRDHDGVGDDADRCPTEPEDKDQFQDEDGCPDPDNDGDGVPDAEDACPGEAGSPSPDRQKNGCTLIDRDGDTFENDVDRCPDAPEVFNGVSDDDGCPDEGGKPLVIIDPKSLVIRFSPKAGIKKGDQDSTSMRALVLELHRHPEWTLAVGVKPEKGAAGDPQKTALDEAAATVTALQKLAHRDNVAIAVSWDTVRRQPGADAVGIAFLLMTPSASTVDPKKPVAPAGSTP